MYSVAQWHKRVGLAVSIRIVRKSDRVQLNVGIFFLPESYLQMTLLISISSITFLLMLTGELYSQIRSPSVLLLRRYIEAG